MKPQSACIPGRILVLAGVSLALMLSSWGAAPSKASPPREPAVIAKPPASWFVRKPLLRSLTLSPDGKHIAAISTGADKDFVVVRPTAGGKLRSVVEVRRDRFGPADTFEWVGWASNDALLVEHQHPRLRSRVNTRSSHYLVVSLDGSRADRIDESWPQDRRPSTYDAIGLLPRDPKHVLLNLRFRSARYPTPHRVDIIDGSYVEEEGSHWGIWAWHVDRLGRIRVAEGAAKPRGGIKEGALEHLMLAKVNPEADLEEIVRWNPLTEDGLFFAAFTPQPETIYVFAPIEPGGRHGIYEYSIPKRKLGELVFQHPEVDARRIATSRVDGRPLYISYWTDRPRQHFLDAEWKRLQAMIDGTLPNRTNRIVSRSLDEKTLIVKSESDVVPPEYYVFDRREGSLALLLSAYPKLESLELAPMKPVKYQARDGLTIHGYLTRPANAGNEPLPTIVFPHGGPSVRDVWGWDRIVQLLASRGFAVFQPNFRGSVGYGEDFKLKGWGEWGLAMQEDITDGVRWLVDQKLADPNRIGIFGISYGGYAALQGLASTPELYKAGASYAGVTDLRLTLSEAKIRFYHDDYSEWLIGDRQKDKAKLDAASPARNADQIRVPVLLGHGTRDTVVDVRQAEAMARALRKQKVPVELYIYENERHGFVDDRNAIDFYTKLVAFFERNL